MLRRCRRCSRRWRRPSGADDSRSYRRASLVGHGAHRHEEGLCEPVPPGAGGVAPRPAVRTSILLSGTPRQPIEGDLARRPRCMPVHEAFGTGSLSVAIAGGWRGDDLVGATRLPAVGHRLETPTGELAADISGIMF